MIYFARHGESQANIDKICAGRTYPAPLTQTGRAQAKNEGERIAAAHLQIDHIVCSPLERARDTARIITATINFDAAKIDYDDRLIEYNMGLLTGKPETGTQPQVYRESDQTENPTEFQSRVMTCVREIESRPGNTLIVSHDYVGRIIKATKQGINPNDFFKIEKYPNAQVIQIS